MMKNFVVVLVFCFLLMACTKRQPIRVACIGDSITEGAGIQWQSKNSYPVQLGLLLGNDYAVLNSGQGGATVLKNGNLPYWTCNEFSNVFVYNPEIVIVKLGTNDSKPQNWNEANFLIDLQSLVDTLRTIPTNPKIFLCLPAPAYNNAWGISDSIIRKGVIPAIQKVASKNQLPVIDLYQPLKNHVEFFPDSIHPNEEGARIIATVVSKIIKPSNIN